MRDKVTISLYSIETNDRIGYNRKFLDEFNNIKKIYEGLVKAALDAGKIPPEVTVSILLVPDWSRENNSYTNEVYLSKKEKFLKSAKEKFETLVGLIVEDFYGQCTMSKEERAYMHSLKAMGSNADMIKTRALINNADRCKHLQLDSNTIIPSFKELYKNTFYAETQKDGLNASYYDTFYVSARNKMVYTTPGGEIHKNSKLEINLWEWCRDHQNDDTDKQATKNSIYSKVFTRALSNIIYTKEYKDADERLLYPATLNKNVYWLTGCMVTAINMSWSAEEKEPPSYARLKQLPSVPIGEDGQFNYQCFANVVKKHTGNLRRHSQMLNIEDKSETGEASRKPLLQNSNSALELAAVRNFYLNAIKMSPLDALNLTGAIDDKPIGDKFTERLFGCSVKELREQAAKITNDAMTKPTDAGTSVAEKITMIESANQNSAQELQPDNPKPGLSNS